MLARFVLLAVLTSVGSAHAAPPSIAAPAGAGPFTLRGKGMRGASTLGGAITRAADGSVSGEFVIMLTSPDDTATACRYRKFDKVRRVGKTVTFDATGACFTVSPNGGVNEWKANNAFSIVQGSPDTIDVNMYGNNGITIPGGALASGDFDLL
jgi:hypothetical protein